MIAIRKMSRNDIPILYDMALRAFAPDYEKFGKYPPAINIKKKCFLPPRILGITILESDVIIGGAFVLALGRKGEIGNIFLDPIYQHKSFGKQALQMIEKAHPRVQEWKLDTPAENHGLHRFYESLGYVRVGEGKDEKSGIAVYKYQKTI